MNDKSLGEESNAVKASEPFGKMPARFEPAPAARISICPRQRVCFRGRRRERDDLIGQFSTRLAAGKKSRQVKWGAPAGIEPRQHAACGKASCVTSTGSPNDTSAGLRRQSVRRDRENGAPA